MHPRRVQSDMSCRCRSRRWCFNSRTLREVRRQYSLLFQRAQCFNSRTPREVRLQRMDALMQLFTVLTLTPRVRCDGRNIRASRWFQASAIREPTGFYERITRISRKSSANLPTQSCPVGVRTGSNRTCRYLLYTVPSANIKQIAPGTIRNIASPFLHPHWSAAHR